MLVLGVELLLLALHLQAVQFSYPKYPALSAPDRITDITCTGWSERPSLNQEQYCSTAFDGNSFDLTVYSGTGENSFNTSARLMYTKPVRWFNSQTGQAASFRTFFVFSIKNVTDAARLGSGMTFLIAPEITTPSFSIGGDLGLFDANTTTGNQIAGQDPSVVAVEIDTHKRGEYDILDVPHIGLDLNSLRSANATYMWNESALVGQKVAVWINYSAPAQYLEVRLMNVTDGAAVTEEDAVVWLTYSGLNLAALVKEYSYVGFSAASGSDVEGRGEVNTVFNWTFQTTGLPDEGGSSSPLKLGLATGLSAAVLLVVCLVTFFFVRRRSRKNVSHGLKAPLGELQLLSVPGLGFDGPREFSYQELKVGTSNFCDITVVGEGGFGKVHKAVLADNSVAAVKRVAEHSRQGQREFLAEITTIGRLRHKNLVPLKGWCRNEDELLLVYEYMPNKSLYDHLFHSTNNSDDDEPNPGMKKALAVSPQVDVLPWERRYNVIRGVASAIHYLHSEWEEQSLIHRDVKSSNVMLDANWNARLGDFGLARVVKKNKSAATVTNAAGTRGYLAPETMYSDKVSAESDIFSFGVLALEVASGRRPIQWLGPPEEKFLVNWVWALNQEGRLLDAADGQLAGEYDAGQMITVLRLGLLCCVEDPTQRPSMRQVLQYLTSGSVDVASFPQTTPPLDYTMGSISTHGTSSSGGTNTTERGLSGVSPVSGYSAATA